MRDGTLLDAVVWRPAAPGRYPVLIERSPYEPIWRTRDNGLYYAQRGYAVIGQVVRGMFGSEGEFEPFRDDGWGENQDGYDTIEWAARQPWSNGNVGMLDGSYSASTQYFAAPTRPPHLRALFARQGHTDMYYDVYYRGGAVNLALNSWFRRARAAAPAARPAARPAVRDPATRARVEQAVADFDRDLWRLPLTSWPPIEGLADWYWHALDHPTDGPYWHSLRVSTAEHEIDTPIMHLTSWFDMLPAAACFATFAGVRAHGRTGACRAAQRLVVGPWLHGADALRAAAVRRGRLRAGGADRPARLAAALVRPLAQGRRERRDGRPDRPPVPDGDESLARRRSVAARPRSSTRQLHLAGSAEQGQGRLTFDAPPADDPPDAFVYDPGRARREHHLRARLRADRLPPGRGPGAGLHVGCR